MRELHADKELWLERKRGGKLVDKGEEGRDRKEEYREDG